MSQIKIMNMSKPVQLLTLKQTNNNNNNNNNQTNKQKGEGGGGRTSSECLQADHFFL